MLVDSNASLRILQKDHPQHQTALDAVTALTRGGEKLCVVPQNLVEIWAVATRPTENNGLGMTIEEAAAALKRLKSLFNVLAETPAIYPLWESLVMQHRVSGKAAHDARIVAAMQAHGETSILTFNAADFKRFPGIKIIQPAEVLPNG